MGSGDDIQLLGWSFDFRSVGSMHTCGSRSDSWFGQYQKSPDPLWLYWSGDNVPASSFLSISADFRHLTVSGVRFATIASSSSKPTTASDPDWDFETNALASRKRYGDFKDPMLWRYQAVGRAARRHIAHRLAMLNHSSHEAIANLPRTDQITCWAGERPVWEEPNMASLWSAAEFNDLSAKVITLLLKDWEANATLCRPRDGQPLVRKWSLSGAQDMVRAFLLHRDHLHTEQPLELFATSGGMLGIATHPVAESDVIVLLKGCRLPVVLHSTGDAWAFKGVCMVYGIMQAELLQIWDELDLREERFVLC